MEPSFLRVDFLHLSLGPITSGECLGIYKDKDGMNERIERGSFSDKNGEI